MVTVDLLNRTEIFEKMWNWYLYIYNPYGDSLYQFVIGSISIKPGQKVKSVEITIHVYNVVLQNAHIPSCLNITPSSAKQYKKRLIKWLTNVTDWPMKNIIIMIR